MYNKLINISLLLLNLTNANKIQNPNEFDTTNQNETPKRIPIRIQNQESIKSKLQSKDNLKSKSYYKLSDESYLIPNPNDPYSINPPTCNETKANSCICMNFAKLFNVSVENYDETDKYFSKRCFSNAGPWVDEANFRNGTLPGDVNSYPPEILLFEETGNEYEVLGFEKMAEQIRYHENDNLANDKIKTYFLVHGFLGSALPRNSSRENWSQLHAQAILDVQKFDNTKNNVLAVDWKKLAATTESSPIPMQPYFEPAAVNTKIVGEYLAYVAAKMDNLGISTYKNMECVGHSLGGQVCGAFGLALKNYYERNKKDDEKAERSPLGTICGLDPAGPGFRLAPLYMRLDKSDAQFVQIIHTQAGGEQWAIFLMGIAYNAGDVDFYPDGGTFRAYCPETLHHYYWGCNHVISNAIYLSSVYMKKYRIKNENLIRTYHDCLSLSKCNSEHDWVTGKCRSGNSLLGMGYGLSENVISGSYFGYTGGQEDLNCIDWKVDSARKFFGNLFENDSFEYFGSFVFGGMLSLL